MVKTGERGILATHELFQSAVRKRATRIARARAVKSAADALTALLPDRGPGSGRPPELLPPREAEYVGKLLAHARVLARYLSESRRQAHRGGYLLVWCAWFARHAGHPDEARELDEAATRLLKKARFRSQGLVYATALNGLAVDLTLLGRPEEARALDEKALEIRSKYLPQSDIMLAWTFSDLGIDWVDLGDPGRARPLLEQAVRLARAVDPPSLAWFLVNAGRAALIDGDLDKATAASSEANDIAERLQDPGLIARCHHLSADLIRRTDQIGALELDKRGLEVRVKHLGDVHPLVAQSAVRVARGWAARTMESGGKRVEASRVDSRHIGHTRYGELAPGAPASSG